MKELYHLSLASISQESVLCGGLSVEKLLPPLFVVILGQEQEQNQKTIPSIGFISE